MKILLALVALVVVVLIGMIVWIGSPRGPRLADVTHLREPHLATLAPQKVLVVTATVPPGPGMFFAGDPPSYLTLIRYPVRKTSSPGTP